MSQSYLADAASLHLRGWTSTDVHARWVLEAFAHLHPLLTDDGGRPLVADEDLYPSAIYLLTAEDWDEVREAAQTIVDLAGLVSVHRRYFEGAPGAAMTSREGRAAVDGAASTVKGAS